MNEISKENQSAIAEEFTHRDTVNHFGLLSQIPNFFTLLNLLFGCIAIVFILQVGQSIVVANNDAGTFDPFFPEKMAWGALFIFFAAVVDFFDGFLARLLKGCTDKGKQLDSLSDVVSFGVAPGMILYQLLRLGYAQQTDGLDVSMASLIPAFLFTGAVAWRLAKFNVSTNQSDSFKGVPSPAAGLVVASFPLIIWYSGTRAGGGVLNWKPGPLLINVWFIYAVIALLSYLMVCNRNFIAIKFKEYSLKANQAKYALLLLSVICIAVLGWLAIPLVFLLYVLLSLLSKQKAYPSGFKVAGEGAATV